MTSRRDFIKQAALLSGSTVLIDMFPESIRRAFAINPQKGSTYMDAEHIVILMQENRSFDHAFGKLKGVRGFNDPRAMQLPNKNKVWLQSNKKGETYTPFRYDIKNTKITWMASLPHHWESMVGARNEGKHNGWLESKKSGNSDYRDMPLTMGFYDREDLPFYYALADAFTICDHNFCSCLTGTTANRHHLWTGALRDPTYRKSKANVMNSDVTYNRWAQWKTFPERLEENGISWMVYQNELSMPCGFEGEEGSWLANFTNNNLEWFEQYGVRYAEGFQNYLSKVIEEMPAKIAETKKKLEEMSESSSEYDDLKKDLEKMEEHLRSARENKETWNREIFEELSEFEKNIHNKAFRTNKEDPHYHDLETLNYRDGNEDRQMEVPKGDVLHQFRKDVQNGDLPSVSWLVAPGKFSDHPGYPWYGAWYISEVMNILTENPEVWKKTIFIINYDENDGYFDHMPPFVPPETGKPETGRISHNIDTWQEFVIPSDEEARYEDKSKARFGPVGLGFRVPLMVISPWSRGGYVNSEVFDQTSTIRLIEKVMGSKAKDRLREDNISPWRRMVCGDLTSAFRPYNGENIPFPPSVDHDEFLSVIHRAQFKDLPEGYKNLTAEEQKQINENPQKSPYMPQQEPGIKDSNALNYHMIADGNTDSGKGVFRLRLEARDYVFGKDTLGVPYILHAPEGYQSFTGDEEKDFKIWNYAVAPGDCISEELQLADFRNGNYHLKLHGPNGFYREFAGNAKDPKLELFCDYEHHDRDPSKLTGNVEIHFNNLSGKEMRLSIVDEAYKKKTIFLNIAPGKHSTVIDLEDSHRWYDFSVKTEGYDHFIRRYAGRVENGEDSKSDPQMA